MLKKKIINSPVSPNFPGGCCSSWATTWVLFLCSASIAWQVEKCVEVFVEYWREPPYKKHRSFGGWGWGPAWAIEFFWGRSNVEDVCGEKKYLSSQLAEGGAGVICWLGNVIINGAIIIWKHSWMIFNRQAFMASLWWRGSMEWALECFSTRARCSATVWSVSPQYRHQELF